MGERSKQVAAENFISVFHVDDFIRVTCEYGEYGTCFLTNQELRSSQAGFPVLAHDGARDHGMGAPSLIREVQRAGKGSLTQE